MSSSLKQGGQSPDLKKGNEQQRGRYSSGNYKNCKPKGWVGGNGTLQKNKQQLYKDKKKAYAVTLQQDSMISEAAEPSGPVYNSNKGKVNSENLVLSGPPKAGMFNGFACDSILAHTRNGRDVEPKEGALHPFKD